MTWWMSIYKQLHWLTDSKSKAPRSLQKQIKTKKFYKIMSSGVDHIISTPLDLICLPKLLLSLISCLLYSSGDSVPDKTLTKNVSLSSMKDMLQS